MKRPFFIIMIFWAIVVPRQIYAMGSHSRGPDYNLLLITIDTLRADHLGCYGYQNVKTPNIDRLAEEGVLFSNAFTPVPITLPSHVSIMTGLYPIQHGIRNNGNFVLQEDAVTLAEVMQSKGYLTSACVGAFVLDSLFGLDQGFDYYDDSLLKGGSGATLLENERKAEDVTRAALEWLKGKGDTPFFLWLHYFDPHAVYLPPTPFDKEYKGHLYDGEIAYTDKCIGDLFKGLSDMELMDKTIVILTSDHGEGLGEHGEPTHAIFIYDSTLHIPLIIRTPEGLLPPGKVNAMVSILDIFPTVAELFSVSKTMSSIPDLPGKSLLPLVTGKTNFLHKEIFCESLYPELNFGWSGLEGIRTPEWKYISAPKPEIYNLASDTEERQNIYPQKAGFWQERLKVLKASLGPEQDRHIGLDDKVRQRLHSLGYIWSEKTPETDERQDPKDMITLLERIDRGVSFIYLGLYAQARSEFKKILEVNPDNASALFYLASIEEKAGNLKEAERLFRGVLALSAHYLDVHNHIGVIYHRQGRLDEALKEFELAIKQAEYPEVYYNLSIVYRQKGLQDEAYKAAKMALDLDSKYADALNELGQLSLDKEAFKEAETYFKQALMAEPNHLEAYNNLGVLYHREGRDKEAVKEFEKALSIDPNSPETLNNLGSIYLAWGQYEKAEQIFKKALQINPGYLEGSINLASVYFYRADYKTATELYFKAAEKNPDSKDAWTHLGLLYLAQTEPDLALKAFEKALEIKPDPETFYYIGQVYLELNHPNKALEFWKKATDLNPDYWQARLQVAQFLYNTGRSLEAIKEWEKAYIINPGDPMPLLNMATARFEEGEYQKAISLWKRALEVDPNLEEPHLHIGTAYLRQNETDMAIKRWERLLEQRPNHIDALINLGTAFYQKRDLDKAIKFWQRAEMLDPQNPKIHYNLGLVFFTRMDCRDSLNELKEALRIDPSNKEVLMLLTQAKRLCPGED